MMTQLKQILGGLGLLAALGGIALQSQWLVWLAIGLLGASIVVRLINSARTRRNGEP